MELMQGASLLSRPADEFGNDSLVEELWAVKAIEHAETHYNLITSVSPRYIRLCPFDNQLYETFRQDFPDMKVDIIDEELLKAPAMKLRWREFAEKFNKLDDYSYGTLMRPNALLPFSPENSMFVFRVQFLAIEIARNREGVNDQVYQQYRKPARSEDDTDTKDEESAEKDNTDESK